MKHSRVRCIWRFPGKKEIEIIIFTQEHIEQNQIYFLWNFIDF